MQATPDREAIAAEQRRQALLRAHQRTEQLLLVALRHEAQSNERHVANSAWLKIALRASGDLTRISQKLGADLQPGAVGQEVAELLATLVS